MRYLRNLPIKRKLTFITMLTSGVALLLACAAFLTCELIVFKRTMVSDDLRTAKMVGDNSSAALTFNDPASAEQTLKALSADPHIVAGAVYDKDGKLFARYQRADMKGDLEIPQARRAGYEFGDDRLEFFHTISLAGDNAGTVYLRSDLGEMYARLWRYALIVVVVILTSSLAAFLLSTRLQAVISEPISQLARVAGVVATERNYSIRAVKQSEDELGRLIDGFNEMLAQIQARDAELQQAQDLLEKRVEERTAELQSEVSERQRSEEALRETNQRFEIVTRATTDVIWDWNLQSDTIWWNKNFQTVFGYGANEVGTRADSWTERIHPEDAPGVLKSCREIIEGGGHLWSGEYRFRRFDGSHACVFDRGYVLRDDLGKPLRMIGALQDITERKQAEEALRTSELKFRQLAENIREVFWITTPDMREVIYVSPAYQEVWGRSTENLYRNPSEWVEAILPEDRPRVFEVCHELASTRPAYDIEFRVQRPDGTMRWIRDRGFQVLDGHGQVYRTAGVASDITERKRAAAELEQAHRQLLDVSRQAGMAEVATGVLHNVGNVLNSINVSATLVGDSLKKSKAANLGKAVALMREHATDLGTFLAGDPKGKQLPGYLGQLAEHLVAEQSVVLNEVEALRMNIEHIKDIVAMQQSYAKVSGVTEIIKVTDLVEDSLRMNAAALTRHAIRVIREYEEIPVISVEKHKVLQILVNLVRNAKYACDESEHADKQLTVRVVRHQDRVRITVSDNGIGIPPENLTRIFAHGFTTRKEGHGFGLHSGALAAKEMGGSLNVRSDGPGKGASFTLELPSERLEQAA